MSVGGSRTATAATMHARPLHAPSALIAALATLSLAAQTPPAPSKPGYQAYALAHEGDPANGKRLFENPARSACPACHSADGSGGKSGPDLSAVGVKFDRAGLVRALLEPSADIAVGYAATRLTLTDGSEALGVVKQSSEAFVELLGAGGLPRRFPRSSIVSQADSPVSLMPEGLHAAYSLQEFADLVAHLQTLRPAPNNGEDLPRARRPATFEPVFGPAIRLDHPLWISEVPGAKGFYAVLEHAGRIWLVSQADGQDNQAELLDLRGIVRRGGASGLLGMAFHPRFAENRRYYLKYQIEESGKISTLIVERRFAENLRADSGEPSRQLFKIPSTTQDHQGGTLLFGPDGFLYFGMGDTGPQRDPQGHGQDLNLLLGKILRVDVDGRGDGLPYAIPADNPFVGRPGVRPEIWAVGFREPWRFSFDSQTGDLWVGDVGQDRIEEVGLVHRGENHGWKVYEGHSRYSETFARAGETYVPPVFSYTHGIGVSVTGGHVYRGKRAPALEGWYVFADFESRRVWGLTHRDRALERIVELGRAPDRAVSFAERSDGELLLVGYDSGRIFRLGLENADPAPLRTRALAETAERAPVLWRFSLSQPSGPWTDPFFDDSAWKQAPAGFGSPGTPGGRIRTEWRSPDIWLRRDFTLPETSTARPTSLTLRIHHDEDAEIFLNGLKIIELPRWTTGYTEVPLDANTAAALRPGKNVLAIRCHQNNGGQYIDAGLVEYLSE